MNFAHWVYYFAPSIAWLRISGNGDSVSEIAFLDEKPPENYSPIPLYLQNCTLDLTAYFEQKKKQFSTSIHFQKGTDFQQKVWNLLLEIPYGKTSTYLKIAEKMGDKKAVRAVGAAIGQNPIPIIVPCHRVLGSNGSLTGFAGGLERKRQLLAIENPERFALQQSLF